LEVVAPIDDYLVLFLGLGIFMGGYLSFKKTSTNCEIITQKKDETNKRKLISRFKYQFVDIFL
jgi:hypothetical protein